MDKLNSAEIPVIGEILKLKDGEGNNIAPYVELDAVGVGEKCAEWVIESKDRWSLSTYSKNLSMIEHYILPYIGKTKLQNINTRFIEQYYRTLQKSPVVRTPSKGQEQEMISPSIIRNVHKILRSCFKQAVKWELMPKNPAVTATVPKYKAKKREIWTAEDLIRATDSCKDPKLKLAINLAFAGSLRIGELLALTWDCVDISLEAIAEGRAYIYVNKETERVDVKALKDLDQKDVILTFPQNQKINKTVRVLKTPKTEESVRKVFLPKTVAEMLVEWKKDQDELKEALGMEYMDYQIVMATSAGLPMSDSVIRHDLNKLIEEYDLPKVVFHSLRHTSVIYKLKLNGGDIKAVQGDSGHSQINMVTDVYSNIIDEDRKHKAEPLEEAFYSGRELEPGKKKTAEAASDNLSQAGDIDPAVLAKIVTNPETMAVLNAWAKSLK